MLSLVGHSRNYPSKRKAPASRRYNEEHVFAFLKNLLRARSMRPAMLAGVNDQQHVRSARVFHRLAMPPWEGIPGPNNHRKRGVRGTRRDANQCRRSRASLKTDLLLVLAGSHSCRQPECRCSGPKNPTEALVSSSAAARAHTDLSAAPFKCWDIIPGQAT